MYLISTGLMLTVLSLYVEKIHKPTTSFGVFVKPLIVWLRCNALLQCCCKVVVVVVDVVVVVVGGGGGGVVVIVFVRGQKRRQRSWFPVHGRMTITVGVGDSWVKKREFVAVWNISSLSNFPFPIHLPFLFSLSLFLPSFSFTLLLIHSTNSPLPPLLPPSFSSSFSSYSFLSLYIMTTAVFVNEEPEFCDVWTSMNEAVSGTYEYFVPHAKNRLSIFHR